MNEILLVRPSDVSSIMIGSQGRNEVTPESLRELASSILAVGVLQPVGVSLDGEEMSLVFGARRLEAYQIAYDTDPDNVNVKDGLPVITVGIGDRSRLDLRTVQLIENLVRVDLGPGETGLALLYCRCELLRERLIESGVDSETVDVADGDPRDVWRALNKLRSSLGKSTVGAPWEDVLKKLGVSFSTDKAKMLVRALGELPEELTSDMDERAISLHTRLELARLDNDVAVELYEEAVSSGSTAMLAVASQTLRDQPGMSVQEALEDAKEGQETKKAKKKSESNDPSYDKKGGIDKRFGEQLETEPDDEDDDTSVSAQFRPLSSPRGDTSGVSYEDEPFGSDEDTETLGGDEIPGMLENLVRTLRALILTVDAIGPDNIPSTPDRTTVALLAGKVADMLTE